MTEQPPPDADQQRPEPPRREARPERPERPVRKVRTEPAERPERKDRPARPAAARVADERGATGVSENQVRLGYRLMLNRTPSPDEVAQMLPHAPTLPDLRLALLNSPEFEQKYTRLKPRREGVRTARDSLWHYNCDFDAMALLHRFHVEQQVPEAGIIRNFLGTRIEPAVHPQLLSAIAGTVEGLPAPGNWHADIAEWAAALLTVERAREVYRIVELGCGWGCWMANMGVAARNRGLKVDLIGVEAEAQHLHNAHRTLRLNGFHEQDYSLAHCIAGPKPGAAIFPRATPGQAGWGGKAIFDPTPEQVAAAHSQDDMQVLECVTLGQLSNDRPIDLLHIDIQGAEVDFVVGNMDQMNRYVRHVLIGTHSRVIEGALIGHLEAAGWQIEMERPAIMPVRGGRQSLAIDGVQLWKGRMVG